MHGRHGATATATVCCVACVAATLYLAVGMQNSAHTLKHAFSTGGCAVVIFCLLLCGSCATLITSLMCRVGQAAALTQSFWKCTELLVHYCRLTADYLGGESLAKRRDFRFDEFDLRDYLTTGLAFVVRFQAHLPCYYMSVC